MVGDRKHDMEGAAYHKLDAAGVLFGFGDREELCAFSPVFLAETPAELGDWLLQG
jgi:phosphoglycolate phosphatase